jgi:hypothetical protein
LNSSFSKDASDTSWLSSLAHAASSPPPPPALSPPHASPFIDTARGSAPDSVVLPTSHRPSKVLLNSKEDAGLAAEVIDDFKAGKNKLLRVYPLHLRNPVS